MDNSHFSNLLVQALDGIRQERERLRNNVLILRQELQDYTLRKLEEIAQAEALERDFLEKMQQEFQTALPPPATTLGDPNRESRQEQLLRLVEKDPDATPTRLAELLRVSVQRVGSDIRNLKCRGLWPKKAAESTPLVECAPVPPPAAAPPSPPPVPVRSTFVVVEPNEHDRIAFKGGPTPTIQAGSTVGELNAEVARQQTGNHFKHARFKTTKTRQHQHFALTDTKGNGNTVPDKSGHVHRINEFMATAAHGHLHELVVDPNLHV